MVNAHELIFLALALLSELLGTLSGFGSSSFFVPLAMLLEPFGVVLILTSFLHVISNLAKMFLFRKHIAWPAIIKFAVPATLMTLVGAALVQFVDLVFISRALGFVLIFLLIVQIYFKRKKVSMGMGTGLVLSSLSGFLTGLFGTGGAIRALALSALSLPKGAFVVTSASVDFLGDLGRLIIYLQEFDLDPAHWFYVPALMVVAWLGSWLGQKALERVSEEKFQIFVSGTVLLVALFTLVRSFYI